MRLSLGCSADAAAPCRGFVGSCVELRETHYRFAAPALATHERTVHPWAPHACHAFPDPTSAGHTFVAGLISFAVCLPCAQLAASCFSLATATDKAQLRGRTRLMRWTFGRAALLFSRAPWRRADGALNRIRRSAASAWCTSLWDGAIVGIGRLLERVAQLCKWQLRPLTHDERTAKFQAAGYVCVAICWVSFVWTILVYGKLIYNMLGGDAANSFTRSWGISVGLAQAQDARDALVSITETVAMLFVLEGLWLLPNVSWMGRTLDEASVHATLLRESAGNVWAAARTYVRFHAAVM